MVGPAGSASLVQPKTKRNVILGVIVGLALGIALAFIRESLDTRVRSADELRARLGLPLLGQVPKPDRRLAQSRQLATLTEPTSSSTEAFRILKNKLEISQLEHRVGLDRDHQPTRGRRQVHDGRESGGDPGPVGPTRHPRRPQSTGPQHRPALRPGRSTSVSPSVAGGRRADRCAQRRRRVQRPTRRRRRDAGGRDGRYRPPDPGEFLLSSFVPEALAALAERCDVLLIDTPPVLAVGDAMTVAKHTDAVILVAGVNRVRRETLIETRHVLDACPAMKLGVIATGGYAAERGSYPQRVRTALTGCAANMPGASVWPRRRAAGTAAEAAKKLFLAISAPPGIREGAGDSTRARRNGRGSGVPARAPGGRPHRAREDGPQQVPDV